MQATLISIEPGDQPNLYVVQVAIHDQQQTFPITVSKFKGSVDVDIIEINSQMLKFLEYEHDLNTPILKAVGQYIRGVPPSLPMLLDGLKK